MGDSAETIMNSLREHERKLLQYDRALENAYALHTQATQLPDDFEEKETYKIEAAENVQECIDELLQAAEGIATEAETFDSMAQEEINIETLEDGERYLSTLITNLETCETSLADVAGDFPSDGIDSFLSRTKASKANITDRIDQLKREEQEQDGKQGDEEDDKKDDKEDQVQGYVQGEVDDDGNLIKQEE